MFLIQRIVDINQFDDGELERKSSVRSTSSTSSGQSSGQSVQDVKPISLGFIKFMLYIGAIRSTDRYLYDGSFI